MTGPRDLLPAEQPSRSRAHGLIPGGAHTYAKGDDQFPVTMPATLVRGRGSRVWDEQGNEYIEYGQGLRAVSLGHGFKPVVKAVAAAAAAGTNFIRPHPIETEAAERFLAYVGRPDWQIKFAKNGSDVTTAALKLARAATGRDMVAICQDQPFFSCDDWFIGTTEMDAGIPAVVKELSVGFPYGDLGAVDDLLLKHGDNLAAVILEAAKYDEPPAGWLEGLISRCRAAGVLVILDEMITAFRWPTGTAMGAYGLDPDLVTFGKAMSNGISAAALIGRPELMELGGLRTDKPRVFLLSQTHGGETIGLAATLAVLDTYETEPVLDHIQRVGTSLRDSLLDVIARHDLRDHASVIGPPQSLVWSVRDSSGEPSQTLRTLVLQELTRCGVLAPSLLVGYGHTHGDVDRTTEAFDHALGVLTRALEDGTQDLLVGPPSAMVFRRHVND